MHLGLRIGTGVLLACALAACGKTEPYWWSDIYASDTGDEVASSESDSESESSESDSESESSESESSESESESSESESITTEESTTDSCPPSPVDLISDPPTVVFLLEQAGHMNQDFGGITRWDAVGTALFDPVQGVAPIWEDEMRLGLTSFTSLNGNQGGACPMLAESAPALANAAMLEATWLGTQPQDENPVGDAVAAVSASLAMDPSPGSKTIVLLTARDPDTCAQPNPQNGANAATMAVDAAFQTGIGTRLIALGNLTGTYAQALANVGVGLPAQGMVMAPWSAAGNLNQLIADLDALLASLRPCSFVLAQSLVPGGEQGCTLELAGQPLTLDDPNGWSVDAGTLLLQGSACSDFQQPGTSLELICECDALE